LYDNVSETFSSHELRAELEIFDSKHARAYYKLLENEKAAIEEEFGEPLTWYDPDNAKVCKIYVRRTADLKAPEARSEQNEWLLTKLEALHKLFAIRIKNLDSGDYQPESEDE